MRDSPFWGKMRTMTATTLLHAKNSFFPVNSVHTCIIMTVLLFRLFVTICLCTKVSHSLIAWLPTQTLFPTAAINNTFFGASAAISQNLIAVGAPGICSSSALGPCLTGAGNLLVFFFFFSIK